MKKSKTKLKDNPFMISCKEFDQFIIDYLERQLPFIKRLIFNLHLLLCSDCRAYIKAYQKSIEVGKKYYEEMGKETREDPPEELLEIIRKLKD